MLLDVQDQENRDFSRHRHYYLLQDQPGQGQSIENRSIDDQSIGDKMPRANDGLVHEYTARGNA